MNENTLRALFFFAFASIGGLAAWRLAGRHATTASPSLSLPSERLVAPPAPSANAAEDSLPAAHAAFRVLSAEVLAALPKSRELQGMSSEALHHGAGPVRDAGASLGRIKLALQDEPRLAPLALETYQDCAQLKEVALPVRALCAANWRDLSRRGLDAPELRDLPSEVKALARRIPSD